MLVIINKTVSKNKLFSFHRKVVRNFSTKYNKNKNIIKKMEFPSVADVPLPCEKTDVRIFLIRHGQTHWNSEHRIQGQTDNALNDIGLSQAKAVGDALKDVSIDAVFCSGLQRASHTADAVHNHFSSKPRIKAINKIMEMNFGSLEGQALIAGSDAETYWIKYQENVANGDLNEKFGGNGETQFEVYTRGVEGLLTDDDSVYKHSKRNGFKTVAAVAHGRFNKILMSGLMWDDCGKASEITQDNCCINVIDIDSEGKPSIVALNITGHMDTF